MPRIAAPVPIPAPYMGINAREGVGALKPAEARALVNWDPEGNALRPRKGYAAWSTGGPSQESVDTLAPYSGLTTNALLGVTSGGSIYNFSNATATLVSAAGYGETRWQHYVYNNYLFAVNGVDTPWRYDGSAISNTGFIGSGLVLSDLVNVRKVRQRLWLCENNSADVWYGGIGSITGALTKFQLSQVVGGGYCMAVAAHSQDAGDGPDDFTCFIMSTGEVVLYSGDPGSTFAKVGNYFMPAPVGRQCFCNVGGGLVVMTRGGLIPIEAAVNGTATDATALGNFGKYAPSLKRDVERYGDNEGWHIVFHESKIIINVPVDPGVTTKQVVFNTLTGAWTTWEDYPAGVFVVYDGGLYFGKINDGIVYSVGGSLDNGEPIRVTSRGAFVSIPGGFKQKTTAVRFDRAMEGSISGRFGIDIDYRETDISAYPVLDIASSTATTPWGSDWGSDWSTSLKYPGPWMGAYGEGHTVALATDETVNASSCEWFGSNLLSRRTGV